METQFVKGKQYYTIDGDSVVFVCEDDGKFIVRAIHEFDDNEPYYGGPFEVRELFTEPPTVKREQRIVELDAEIKERDSTLEERRLELKRLELQIRNIEIQIARPTAEVVSKLSLVKGLEKIEDCLAGRLTHFVWIADNQIEILDKSHYRVTNSERYLKMITLYGNSNGDFQWRIQNYSMYRDDVQIWPFTSLEEARAKAIELLEESGKYLVGHREQYKAKQYLANAKSLGVEPSALVVEFLAKCTEEKRQYEIAQKQAELAKLIAPQPDPVCTLEDVVRVDDGE